MIIYKRKSMEYFDILSINNPYYQCVVCHLSFGIETSRKLMDIFKKLGVKSAFKSVTHNLDGQLDYVLIRKDIQSNKYLAGNFKNLYSDHRSLFLRIPTDKNVIPVSPPINT